MNLSDRIQEEETAKWKYYDSLVISQKNNVLLLAAIYPFVRNLNLRNRIENFVTLIQNRINSTQIDQDLYPEEEQTLNQLIQDVVSFIQQ